MKRNTLLKLSNPILGVLAVNQIGTGLLADRMPPETFQIMHQYGGLAFAAVALLHVILNWNWIKANYLRG